MRRALLLGLSWFAAAAIAGVSGAAQSPASSSHPDLVRLFDEWRAFERPASENGAPDYTAATLARKQVENLRFLERLNALPSSGWTRDQQIDHALVRAQIQGFDFSLRVLQPWARDPAFYKSIWTGQSDTPEHEGPTHHAVVELWQYRFPLSPADEAKLAGELRSIPPLLQQARGNLTGNARDLWRTGTGTMQTQIADLGRLAERTASAGAPLRTAVTEATRATESFVSWLESEAPKKTGPSGIGKEAYNWSLRHVHLIPMTWDDEVALLRRELDRAHAALKLEEHRNRNLPPLVAASSPEEFDRRANAAATKFLAFLGNAGVLTMEPYLDAALRAHLGSYVPIERRNFFAMGTHYEPVPLYSHFYHWFDHAWMRERPHPSPIRRTAWYYNTWDSRSEGMATAFEEIVLHAGYYDDNPRAREIVWIMLAQRAARGLASLYAQANEFDIAEAKAFQVEWTPRGWMRPDLDLLGFEQQLYLRQPGYGTSYVTGKALIDDLIRRRARQLGDRFTLRGFFDEVNAAGMMPMSLVSWQITGASQTPQTAPTPTAPAQGQGRGGPQTPQVTSPEVGADRRITFRIHAPQAQAVRVSAGDIPGLGQTGVMSKDDRGVWTFTTAALPAGAYRYHFNVDGLAVIDPRNPATSTSNNTVWSLALVAGSEVFDTKQVPHGAVAAVTYYSTPLQRHRRMHVYTPPGYESNSTRYPVFYLLHGAGDSDEAWTSVGRAGIILDNLIAAKMARPMIVVMTAGHTNGPTPGVGGPAPALTIAPGGPDEFTQDFTEAVRPYVERHYRVLNGREHRAIAGLSMGGSQTLNIAIRHLNDFAYVGVFSSGLLGGRGRGAGATGTAAAVPFGQAWENQHAAMLGNAAAKKGLRLVWFATGTDDFLLETTRSTVSLLKRHGFDVTYRETDGGHTWLKWRDYLAEFAPLLFR